jgi:glutathione S-transferase
MKLYIGNKNYSSWSMRPWVVLTHAGIAFEEVTLWFDSFSDDSRFKQQARAVSAVGTVPILEDDGLLVSDSLAIVEYLAEKFPQHKLWPQDAKSRARARSACAEMHAGFGALSSACPMNIEADLSLQGAIIVRDKPQVTQNLQRISQLWGDLLNASGGPFLFGEFSIADAYFAPVCMRIRSYRLPVGESTSGSINEYVSRVSAASGVQAWITAALAEQRFVAEDEPYRLSR